MIFGDLVCCVHFVVLFQSCTGAALVAAASSPSVDLHVGTAGPWIVASAQVRQAGPGLAPANRTAGRYTNSQPGGKSRTTKRMVERDFGSVAARCSPDALDFSPLRPLDYLGLARASLGLRRPAGNPPNEAVYNFGDSELIFSGALDQLVRGTCTFRTV
ncbi:hypothetical protein ZHAS_00015717 [Anopheles sinensis]|uniref:Uncharacterized protein n=1 Tax=Anopheles sinensis TaxID=74873 RepID=A0A084WBS8_ANOSI|nr:hypothetical protein ZHAS_00015717 [Anopheles sinensis]